VRRGRGGALALLAALAAFVPQSRAAEVVAFEQDGRSRFALVDPVAGEGPHPAIVLLHGAVAGAGIMRLLSRFPDAARARGLVFAMPSAEGAVWRDGDLSADLGALGPDGDDVEFIDAVLDRLAAWFAVDPGRIHLVGQSNGGMMAYRYACERAGRLASVTVMLATPAVSDTERCRPGRAVPMTMMLGTDDRMVAWDGRLLTFLPGLLPDRMPALAGLALWRRLNGCEGEPGLLALPHVGPGLDRSVVLHQPTGCPAAAPVRLFEMRGVGHRVPGHTDDWLMRLLLGPGTADVDAVAVVLEQVMAR